jgi:hypothetical protein
MIKRIIPNLNVTDATAGHEFYVEFLGLEKAFDLGWIASFRSPGNPAAPGEPCQRRRRGSRGLGALGGCR